MSAKTTYDIRITDKRPKAVVREMLRQYIGPRDYKGRDALWPDWWAILDREGYSYRRFAKWLRSQDWTLGEMMAYLEYQVVYIFGGVDEEEFAKEWAIVKPVFDRLDLLDPAWIAQVTDGDTRTPAHVTAAAQDLAVIEM